MNTMLTGHDKLLGATSISSHSRARVLAAFGRLGAAANPPVKGPRHL